MMGARWTALAGAVLRPVAAAVPMGVVLLVLGRFMENLPAPLELGLLIAAGIGVYVVFLRFTAPQLVVTASQMVRRKIFRTEATTPTTPKGRS